MVFGPLKIVMRFLYHVLHRGLYNGSLLDNTSYGVQKYKPDAVDWLYTLGLLE